MKNVSRYYQSHPIFENQAFWDRLSATLTFRKNIFAFINSMKVLMIVLKILGGGITVVEVFIFIGLD